MFDPKIIQKLAQKHSGAFQTLNQIEVNLNNRFAGLELPIRALVLSVASGEPLLLIGPPGTAKSRLIRAFCGLIGLLNENDPSESHEGYFEYLLTPFTEPGELFGFYNIGKAMKDGELKRIEDGMMQQAKVVYLDEVFNGSSAILNSILAFLNERIFHDRGSRKKVAMQCLFAATNQVPDTAELRAVFDRFVLRCQVDNIEANADSIGELLEAGWRETYSSRSENPAYFSQLLEEMVAFRQTIRDFTTRGYLKPQPNHNFYKNLAQLVHHARQYELSEMSNRRLVKMTQIMLIHAIYEAVREKKTNAPISLGTAELQLLPRYFLDHMEEETARKLERLVFRNNE